MLHLYEYDYRPRLNARVSARSPAMQAMSMALAVTFSFPSLWRALIGRRGTDLRQKLQTLYGVGLFMMVCLYLVLLAGSALAAMDKVGDEAARTDSAGVVQPAQAITTVPVPGARAGHGAASTGARTEAGALQDAGDLVAGTARWGWGVLKSGAALATRLARRAAESGTLWLTAVLVPLIGAFTRFNLREALGRAAPMISSAGGYLMAGESRAEILGELAQVFNHLEEGGVQGRKYDRVHLLAYSFGSIVAIDALFPVEAPASRRLGGVSTLLTVGCPYDFVRTYWPDYFRNRHPYPGAALRWINVYSPMDVLGSDFHDQPTLGEWFRSRGGSAMEQAGKRRELRSQTRRGIDLVDGGCIRPEGGDNVCWGSPEGVRLGFWDMLTFMGFRAHEMYWSREVKSAFSCYAPLVNRLLAKDPGGILA